MSTVLYRKYRAKTFADIRGQQTVVSILANAIKQDNISHAYLFSGPRGTGKTSMARLVAKAVNDPEFSKNSDINPEHVISIQIDDGSFMDLIEIDAASNRGIEEVRQIKDSVNYLPTIGKYKVFIIDEVHMLTREAFNALLKTLEEPPAHVIFILATTEPHKVPDTILSRVQRFDFRLATQEELIGKLAYILEREGLQADEQALSMIYAHSGGSYRDAESVLGKILGEGADSLSTDYVKGVLGLAPQQTIDELIQSVREGDITNALDVINQLVTDSIDPVQFLKQMAGLLRTKLVDLAKSNQEYTFELKFLKQILKAQNELRFVDDTFMVLEMLVIEFMDSNVTKTSKTSKPSKSNNTEVELSKKKVSKVAKNTTNSNNLDNKGDNTWKQLLENVKGKDFRLWAHLKTVTPKLNGSSLVLSSAYSKTIENMRKPNNLELITNLVEKLFGEDIGITIELVESDQSVILSNEKIVESIF